MSATKEHGVTFVARYTGRCGACPDPIKAGEKVRYRYPGKILEHEDCRGAADARPPEGALLSSAPARGTKKRNRRAGSCDTCGMWIKAGAGELIFCMEDGACMKHFDEPGYHVRCLDPEACEARRAERQAAEGMRRLGQAIQAAALASVDVVREIQEHRNGGVDPRLAAGPDGPCATYWIAIQAGGSERLWATDDRIGYTTSHYDDGLAVWSAPRTPELAGRFWEHIDLREQQKGSEP